MTDKNMRMIFENAHAIAINMNDIFYYSCADISCINIDELEDLEPVINKYGFDAFIAFEAIKRGHDPVIKTNVTSNFKSAKQMIIDIINNADEYGDFFDLRHTLKTIKPLQPNERKKVSKYISKLSSWFSFFMNR